MENQVMVLNGSGKRKEVVSKLTKAIQGHNALLNFYTELIMMVVFKDSKK